VDGSIAAATVGIACGCILTRRAVTAETGQFLWLLAVLAGTSVIPEGVGSGLSVTTLACTPFVAGLFATLIWSGDAELALAVGYAVAIKHAVIPLAGFTEREMTFRWGLFLLFVLTSAPPACLTGALFLRGLRAVVLWPIRPGAWGATILGPIQKRLWRCGISALFITLAVIA
jgi:hypothetical protein